jgi:hypothetical protein
LFEVDAVWLVRFVEGIDLAIDAIRTDLTTTFGIILGHNVEVPDRA